MAGRVIEMVLKLRDEASSGVSAVADSTAEAAAAEEALQKGLQAASVELDKVGETAATAAARLETLAARGNQAEQLALQLRRTRAEISSLAEQSGDYAMARRASAAADKQFAEGIARLNARSAQSAEQLAHMERAAQVANARLEALAARGDEAQQLALKLRRAKTEIQALAAATGNQELAARAAAAAERDHEQAMARLQQRQAAATRSTQQHVATNQRAAVSSRHVAFAMQNLAVQSTQVAASLGSGIDPMMVLMQQGPDFAMVLQDGALASELFAKAASFGPVLAALGIALGAGAVAYSEYQLAADDAAEANGRMDARLDETAQRAEAARARLVELSQAWGAVKRSVADAEVDLQVAIGTMDRFTAQADRQVRTLHEQSRESILASGLVVASLEDQVAAQKALANSTDASVKERVAAQKEEARLRAELDAAKASLADRRAEVDRGVQAIRDLAEYERELADEEERLRKRTEATTAAERRATQARRDQAAATRQLNAELAVMAQMFEPLEQGAGGTERIRGELEGLDGALDPLLTAFERLKLLSQDLDIAFSRGTITLGEYREGLAAIDTAFSNQVVADTKEMKATAEQAAAELQRVAQTLQAAQQARVAGAIRGGAAVLGGDVLGAAGTLAGAAGGPGAAAAVGALSGLTGIATQAQARRQELLSEGKAAPDVATLIGQEVAKNLEGQISGIVAVLQAVPGMLPMLIEKLGADLPVSLLKAIPGIVKGLVAASPKIVSGVVRAVLQVGAELIMLPFKMANQWLGSLRRWWKESGGFKGVTRAIASWWREGWAAIKAFFRQLNPFRKDSKVRQAGRKVGGLVAEAATLGFANTQWDGRKYAAGGMVDRTGLALVHQNERIIPPTGAGTMSTTLAAALGGGGGGLTVNIGDGMLIGTVDQLVRELARHLGTDNRGLSWPAGS